MAVTDLPLFSMLKTRMRWLEERQKVLAENVANANTPNYQGRDLKQLDFRGQLEASLSPVSLRMNVTQPGHVGGATGVDPNPSGGFESTPGQGTVILEDEMMKVAQTQLDHQTAISLYTRGLGMIKTALGKA
jgi:flagellar basal-body rod protein FlgB